MIKPSNIIWFSLVLWLILTAQPLFAQKVTLSGYVRDKATGEEIIGATVYVPALKTGALTNEYGYYAVSLPKPDTYLVEYQYASYEVVKRTILLTKDTTINIELVDKVVELNTVEIEGEKPNENLKNLNMSTAKLDIKTVKTLPAFLGEADILKTIQLLPGIQFAGEGNAGFYVRGGGADQNLVLLDEATVFNASHLLGFFSVFNSDAIKDVEIYKGGIPAKYGGRVSSIVDVRMKEGNDRKYTATGGIGTISSRLTLEGPIIKEKGSFIISGRRTYADIFLAFSPDAALRDTRLYFYDFNAKANYRFSTRDRVFISGYFGRDVFRGGNLFGLEWGNATLTTRWNHLFSDRLFSNLTLIYSTFDYGSRFTQGSNSAEYKAIVRNYGVKYDFSYFHSSRLKFYIGAQATLNHFTPGVFTPVGQSFFNQIKIDDEYGTEIAQYLDGEYELNDKWSIRTGLRLSQFLVMGPRNEYKYVYSKAENKFLPSTNVGDTIRFKDFDVAKVYFYPEPRLALRYRLDPASSIKLSYNRTLQYIHQAANNATSSPFDLWILSSSYVKPQIGDQVAVGYFRNFLGGGIETSIEVFYKYMYNQIDFRPFANLVLNEHLHTEFLIGEQWSYGTELFVQKKVGRYTGWVSYTLSRTMRQIPDPNNPDPYPFRNDRRHNVSVVSTLQLTKRLILGTTWVFLTGQAATLPVGQYYLEGQLIPLYGQRNTYRFPDYHRLDVSLTLESKKKENRRYEYSYNFSLFNAYNRANAWSIEVRNKGNRDLPTNPDVITAQPQEAIKTYLFGIVPAITFNFKY